jgi:amino acid transporter
MSFVIGDMKNPKRDLPRVLHSAMFIVLTSFALMNTALYICLPFESMRTSSTTVVVSTHRHSVPSPILIADCMLGIWKPNPRFLGKNLLLPNHRHVSTRFPKRKHLLHRRALRCC